MAACFVVYLGVFFCFPKGDILKGKEHRGNVTFGSGLLIGKLFAKCLEVTGAFHLRQCNYVLGSTRRCRDKIYLS